MNNEFCYHVATIQRLHTAPTVNTVCSELKKRAHGDTYITQTLKVFEIYDQLTVSKRDDKEFVAKIYNDIRDWYTEYVNLIVNTSCIHGYMPEYLLTYIILPCLHAICDDNEFSKILTEISIEANNFQRASYVYTEYLASSKAYVKEAFQKEALELYERMLKHIPQEIPVSAFSATVIEVYTEPNNPRNGHAVTLLRNDKNDFCVIDDNRNIQKLSDYYNAYRERLWKMDIRDITSETANEINRVLREHAKINTFNQFEARETRYTIDFSNNFIDYTAKVAAEPIKKQVVTGGAKDKSHTSLFICVILVSALVSVIVSCATFAIINYFRPINSTAVVYD
jgi:hypothetical protein